MIGLENVTEQTEVDHYGKLEHPMSNRNKENKEIKS